MKAIFFNIILFFFAFTNTNLKKASVLQPCLTVKYHFKYHNNNFRVIKTDSSKLVIGSNNWRMDNYTYINVSSDIIDSEGKSLQKGAKLITYVLKLDNNDLSVLRDSQSFSTYHIPQIKLHLEKKTNQFKDILGYKCRLYLYKTTHGNETKNMQLWITEQVKPNVLNENWVIDFNFTIEGLILEKNIEGEHSYVATLIEYKALPDSIFYKQ